MGLVQNFLNALKSIGGSAAMLIISRECLNSINTGMYVYDVYISV